MAETHVVFALRAKRAEVSGYIHDMEKKVKVWIAMSASATPDKVQISGNSISMAAILSVAAS